MKPNNNTEPTHGQAPQPPADDDAATAARTFSAQEGSAAEAATCCCADKSSAGGSATCSSSNRASVEESATCSNSNRASVEESAAFCASETADQALLAELDEAQQRVGDLNDKLLRLHAEMDNLRKRHQRELENAYKFANEKILLDLLPVKDSLDLGLVAGRARPDDASAILEGVELIQQMLAQVLERHKILLINPLGEKFNPEQHEAIAMTHSSEYASGLVMDVIQTGYQLNGRVTRPARVVVSRGAAPATAQEGDAGCAG